MSKEQQKAANYGRQRETANYGEQQETANYGEQQETAPGTANYGDLMTEGPVKQRIIRFAIPVFVGNLFQQLYSFVDSKLRVYFQQHMNMIRHDFHFQNLYRKICSILCEQLL